MLTLAQVPGLLQVDATWSFSPSATIVSMTLNLYEGAAATGTPIATVAPASSGAGTIRVTTAVPAFTSGQQVIGKLDIIYASLPNPTQSFTSDVITLGPGTSTPLPIPLGTAALPAFDTALPTLTQPLASATRLVGRVAGPAANYRSSYLRAQAIDLVEQAMRIERQIVDIQALDVQKITTAQLLAYPAFSSALSTVGGAWSAGLPTMSLTGPIGRLGGALREYLLFQRIVDWLARTDILEFWYGLFRVLVEDVSRTDSALQRTRTYLAAVFGGAFSGQINALYADVAEDIEAAVASVSGAVRAALAAATGTVRDETRQLFASLDAPLVASPRTPTQASPPGPDDVLDTDPLAGLLQQLDSAVDQQLAALRTEARSALQNLGLQQAQDLFVTLATTYLCLPLLAAVGVAVTGGPFSAALLTAAVFVAGQELLHLVLKWLGGPLGDALEGLRGRVDAARRELEAAIAGVAAAATVNAAPISGAARQIQLSAIFLRELSHLVPDLFLSSTADLLGRKRDELLRRSSELALAAELSQGHEHATVFDAIRPTYMALAPGRLPEAPQLPGGTGSTRHVAETLLADIHRLDEQRLELVDGKETLVTKRISLFDLTDKAALGFGIPSGTATTSVFMRLLKGEPVAVRLDEGDLLDGTHPGAYRALIDEVRVFAPVLSPVSPAAQIPVLITHAGTSRTRVRRPGGAREGLSQQALTLLFSPAVCEAAYRRAIAGAQRVNQAMGMTNYSWSRVLAVPLWKEALRAAATNELMDIEVMRGEWFSLMWSLGFPNVMDDEVTGASVIQTLLVTEFFAILFNPPGPVNAAHGTPSNLSPTSADIARWAQSLSPTLVTRTAQLTRNPIRGFQKWSGQVRLLEEIDPGLRDTGFLTLERVHEAQAMTVQLAPDPAAAVSTATQTIFAAPRDGRTARAYPEQTRPFENLGLTTTLQMQLPGAIGQTTGLYDVLAPQIKDVVLELDIRVCYDPELESAVRASRRRAAQLFTLVDAQGRGPIALPGVVGITEIAAAPRRTLQLSLRALRDRALIAWKQGVAALDARGTSDFDPADGITRVQVNALNPLTSSQPLSLLSGGAQPTFTLRFGQIPPVNLAALATGLTIDPTQLGIGNDLFALLATPSLPAASVGAIHALGIAVVPMSQGFSPWGGGRITLGSTLLSLFAGMPQPPWVMAGSQITSGRGDVEGTTTAIPLTTVFNSSATSTIAFEFGQFVSNMDIPPGARPDPIYDIIITIAYSPPVVQLVPATSALL